MKPKHSQSLPLHSKIMDFRAFLLPLLLIFSSFSLSSQDAVTVSVGSQATIAQTDDNFVCATIDWWPPEKCDYGLCPWGNTSILNLDLRNPILFKAVRAFGPLRIRLGGSLQDQVVYAIGPNLSDCEPSFVKIKNGMFGFSQGCLSSKRWDVLNKFLGSAGAITTFGLNALNGRQKAGNGLYTGNWNSSNAQDFIEYSVSMGYNIDSLEFGNELSGSGIAARVNANQYAADLIALKAVINHQFRNSASRPMILAPGGFFDAQWFAEMLQASGPGAVDIVSHHIYNLGAGVDPNLVNKILDGNFLDKVAQTYQGIETTIKDYGYWTSAWVSESGGAYNSGGRVASHTFVDSFWYLDQLGMTSTFGHKVFCRQTLIGGNYGLLNTTTFVPNPDYYSALLWHRLMGPGVLRTTHNGPSDLRAYTHCSRGKDGITMLLINLSNSTLFTISVGNDLIPYAPQMSPEVQLQREEYHLTGQDGDVQSSVMLLNGQPLGLTNEGEIPDMFPIFINDALQPVYVAPLSIVFVRFMSFNAPACYQ